MSVWPWLSFYDTIRFRGIEALMLKKKNLFLFQTVCWIWDLKVCRDKTKKRVFKSVGKINNKDLVWRVFSQVSQKDINFMVQFFFSKFFVVQEKKVIRRKQGRAVGGKCVQDMQSKEFRLLRRNDKL